MQEGSGRQEELSESTRQEGRCPWTGSEFRENRLAQQSARRFMPAGIFDGGMRSTIPEHHQRRYTDASALSRIGDPRECGELVAWLISKRNTYLTGTVIFLDGGTLG